MEHNDRELDKLVIVLACLSAGIWWNGCTLFKQCSTIPVYHCRVAVKPFLNGLIAYSVGNKSGRSYENVYRPF
jgi:hypothetical protein